MAKPDPYRHIRPTFEASALRRRQLTEKDESAVREAQRLAEFLKDRQTCLGSNRASAGKYNQEAWDDYERAWTLLQGMAAPSAPAEVLRRKRDGYASEVVDAEWRIFLEGAQAALPVDSGGEATLFMRRFGDAMQLLCRGNRPSDEMMQAWLDNDNEDLQSFASVHTLGWAQGLGVIDAALTMADTPTEGDGHEERERPEDPQLDDEDIAVLREELEREDLSVYTVVRMARQDLDNGEVSGAMSRLLVDADKFRAYDTPLNDLLMRWADAQGLR